MHNGGMRTGGLDVEIVEGLGPRREEAERQALDAGFHLPLSHTLAWAQSREASEALLLVLKDGNHGCRGVIALERARSRALPGHDLLRARRVGSAIAADAHAAAANALFALAHTLPRVLRVSVELFERDADRRASLALAMADVGFRTSPVPRSYVETLTLDLTPDENILFEQLRPKTRRDIRAAAKHGLEVRPVTDAALAPRLDELARETMARTNGPYHPHDWPALIALSMRHSERARIVGLFRGAVSDASALVAFSVGYGHGDHGEYNVAASTRAIDVRVPLAYVLLWDLVVWAKRWGASWFDLGGVTRSRLGDDDALGGISDFKRYFSKERVSVGEEWVLEPRPARAGLANVLSAGAAWLSGVRPRA